MDGARAPVCAVDADGVGGAVDGDSVRCAQGVAYDARIGAIFGAHGLGGQIYRTRARARTDARAHA